MVWDQERSSSIMKRKVGAKRLYHYAWPHWEFADHLSWRKDQNTGHGTNKSKIHRLFSKRVRRLLERELQQQISKAL